MRLKITRPRQIDKTKQIAVSVDWKVIYTLEAPGFAQAVSHEVKE